MKELLGEAAIMCVYLAPFFLLLGIGGLIADYVLPHIPFIQRFLDSLPEYEDDDDTYEEYLRERREKKAQRQRRAVRK